MEKLCVERQDLVNRGYWRRVYRHPHRRGLCVKTPRRGGRNTRYLRRELSGWKNLEASGCDMSRLPTFHGCVETQFGVSSVWELISCANDRVAPPLDTALHLGLVNIDHCRARLRSFGDWMIANGVIGSDLKLSNLVCRFDRRGDFELVFVDGWENSELVPVSSWSPLLRQQKVQRRWKRFLEKFERYLVEGPDCPAWQVHRKRLAA
ncbi:MAG: YrbL family protein [Planctomycetota bacterium]